MEVCEKGWRQVPLHGRKRLMDEPIVALAVNGNVDVEDAAGTGARVEDASRDALVVLEVLDVVGDDYALPEQGAPSLGDPGLEKHKDRGARLADVQDVLDERLLLLLSERGLGELGSEAFFQDLPNRTKVSVTVSK